MAVSLRAEVGHSFRKYDTIAPKNVAATPDACLISEKMAHQKYASPAVLDYSYHCAVLEVKQVRLGVKKTGPEHMWHQRCWPDPVKFRAVPV